MMGRTMGRTMGRGSAFGRAVAIVGAGMVFAACTGSNPPKVAPLPATTTTTGSAATSAASLPAGCDGETRKRTEVQYATVEGVDPALLSLDVYTLAPECGPRPTLVWVHGGEWNSGDKRTAIQPLADLAAQRGWVLVSVNYRLSTEGSGVVWPTHGTDVAAAIAHTVEHHAEYGIDAAHVAVMGYEAGGHLATMVAVDPALLRGEGASDRRHRVPRGRRPRRPQPHGAHR